MITTTTETLQLNSSGHWEYSNDYDYEEPLPYIPYICAKAENAELQRSVKIVSLVIYSLVVVLGVLGNGVVIWVTAFKMNKTINTVWYLNLVVADFLFTAFLPLRITERALDGHWPFGSFTCKLNNTVLFLNMYASIYSLMVISIDKCVCVVWPAWAQNHRSIRKASCVSLGVWVLALALSSPYFIFKDTISICDKNITTCSYKFARTDDSTPTVFQLIIFRTQAMIITRFLMGFVVPFTVIVSCYSVIIYRLRRNRSLAQKERVHFTAAEAAAELPVEERQLPAVTAGGLPVVWECATAHSQSWRRRQIRSRCTRCPSSGQPIRSPLQNHSSCYHHIFSVLGPHHILQLSRLMMTTAGDSETLEHVIIIVFCLAYINSCLIPLLYVFMGQDFKNEVRKSVLKVLENAFTEELPQTNTSTNPGTTSHEIALSGAQV